MTHDSIADLLTRLRNAYMARLREARIPHSILKEGIIKILVKNRHIVSYEVQTIEGSSFKKELVVVLNDVRETKYLPTFRRVSRPGQRIYAKSQDVVKSKNGYGIYILSTPKGIITGYEARALNVGGEVLCEVY